MGFELNEIGATLAAGMYFVLGLGVLGLVLQPDWGRAALARVQASKLPFAIVGSILAFAIGIFLERLSNLAADALPVLPNDAAIRCDVFHDKFADDYALEVAHLTAVWGPRASAMIQQLARDAESGSPTPGGRAAATEIYFEAKSAVMRDSSYAADLMLTQTHIRFTRSFAVTSFAVGVLALIIGAVRIVLGLRPRWAISGGVRSYARDCGIIVAVFAALWWATSTAYGLEEEHYDARVYGYYLHMIRAERTG